MRQISLYLSNDEFAAIERTAAVLADGNKNATCRVAIAWFCDCVRDQGEEFVAAFQPSVSDLPRVKGRFTESSPPALALQPPPS